MPGNHHLKRFKANPIEVMIFSIISLIFFYSVYHLFYDFSGFKPIALVPMMANPISEGRSLASVAKPTSLETWSIPCDPLSSKETQSTKIRLTGQICSSKIGIPQIQWTTPKITNSNNQYSATVFTDAREGQYSTDYIPLVVGKNLIHLEFSRLDGEKWIQDLEINRINGLH